MSIFKAGTSVHFHLSIYGAKKHMDFYSQQMSLNLKFDAKLASLRELGEELEESGKTFLNQAQFS